jgi:subtilisin family serine protease
VSYEPDRRAVSPLIGDLLLPPDLNADSPLQEERVPALVELNARYPGGLKAVMDRFLLRVWEEAYEQWAHEPPPVGDSESSVTEPRVPAGLRRVTPKLYQCILTRPQCQAMVDWDKETARDLGRPPAIFKVWPDYELQPQIDRSAPTVKADAGWRSYNARGRGVVWAVLDSGVEACHPHFASLEIGKELGGGSVDPGAGTSRTAGLHRDFREFVNLKGAPAVGPESPLTDEQGHGTHVAGIIAGCSPAKSTPIVAASEEPAAGGGYVPRARVSELSGMAPECELVSCKVLRENAHHDYVTSSSAIIRALDYLRTEVNVDPAVLRVHGVNISLGCPWDPTHYAAGQSPLSQAVNQLVDSGVVVVISAGNSGAGYGTDPSKAVAALGSIMEPAHADNCIAVGSTHREAPHAFGVTWTSSKGPTLDGRLKPDIVAPGEWITSAAVGTVRVRAGLPAPGASIDSRLTYAEQSGTSMAAPHVSGVVAAFLSARPEFIGRPRAVKALLLSCATDLGRERYAQGAGLVDLMRMLANV